MNKRLSVIFFLLIITTSIFSSCNKKTADTEITADNAETEVTAENLDNVSITENINDSEKITGVLKIDTYKESTSPVNYSIQDKNTAAIQFNVKKPFSGVEIFCTTVGNDKQNISISLYEFDTDYLTTVEVRKPLITQDFKNISDNSWLMLKFKNKPIGSYLIVIHSGTKYSDLISEASSPILEQKIVNYYNGIKIETGAFRFRILFNEKNTGGDIDTEQYLDSLPTVSKSAEN